MIDNYIFCDVCYALYNYKFKLNSNTQHDGFYVELYEKKCRLSSNVN